MWQPIRLSVAIIGLVALACGAPTPGPAAGRGSEQPKYGGVLNLRNSADMTDWDMRVNGQNGNNVNAIRLAYDSLLAFKQTPHPNISYFDNAIIPELAERWEVSSDAKTYTFHLRKDIKWANMPPVNGRELTSADVKWSYEYQSSTGQFANLPPGQNSFMYEGLAGVDAPDPYTVVVRFKDGFAPFINYAGSAFNPIYPKELLAVENSFTTNILGTGAFQWDVAETQKGTRWVFTKNPTYWDAASVYLDKIRYLVIPEDATAQAAFQTRQLDILDTSSGPAITEIAAANPNALTISYPYTPRYLLMHFEKPPLDNMKVRLAISRAIDRDEFVKVQGGRGTWGLAGTNTWVDLFTAEETKQIYRYDVNEAKRLLAEAGYSNGINIKLMTDLGSDAERTLAQLLQAQLKRSGITVELDVRTREAVSADRKRGDFQMHWFNEYPRSDPDYSLFGYYSPGQRLNYTRVNDPKLTQLVAAQRQEPDPTKRREIMRQAIRYLNETALGIGIERVSNAVFWHPYVKNYSPHQDHGYASINSWLDK